MLALAHVGPQVAEYLYDVLSNRVLQKNCVPVLVILNKTDLPTAQTADRVINSLQAELYAHALAFAHKPHSRGQPH